MTLDHRTPTRPPRTAEEVAAAVYAGANDVVIHHLHRQHDAAEASRSRAHTAQFEMLRSGCWHAFEQPHDDSGRVLPINIRPALARLGYTGPEWDAYADGFTVDADRFAEAWSVLLFVGGLWANTEVSYRLAATKIHGRLRAITIPPAGRTPSNVNGYDDPDED